MSYIRTGSERKYSDGGPMYVYLETSGKLRWMVGDPTRVEDFVEVLFRVLERADVNFDDNDVESVQEELRIDDMG